MNIFAIQIRIYISYWNALFNSIVLISPYFFISNTIHSVLVFIKTANVPQLLWLWTIALTVKLGGWHVVLNRHNRIDPYCSNTAWSRYNRDFGSVVDWIHNFKTRSQTETEFLNKNWVAIRIFVTRNWREITMIVNTIAT